MVKVKVTEDFRLEDFNKLANIKRASSSKDKKGHLYVNDTFECDDKMVDYLTGNNKLNRAFIEVIEVIPEEETIEEEKPILKKNNKKKGNK